MSGLPEVHRYTPEGAWDAGVASERERLRKLLEAMRKEAEVERTKAFRASWMREHARLASRCDALAEVLALLEEPT